MGSPFNTNPAERPRQRAVFLKFLTELLSRGILKKDGVWIAPDPAPLTAQEVTRVFELVRDDHRYTEQKFVTRTVDDKLVVMLKGVITTEPEPT